MCLIVIDVVGIQQSPTYDIFYAKVYYNQSGGSHSFPFQSQTTFMIGLSEFTSPSQNCFMSFFTVFSNPTGDHKMEMLPSSPRLSKPPITRFVFYFFYLNAWDCPAATFYNRSIYMCEECTIGCLTCLNKSACTLCDTANGYLLNTVTGVC